MYDVVFKKSPKGNMIVTRCPDMSGVEWSEAQNAHRARFGQATAYAKAALADPDLWAIYEARAAKEKKSAFDQRVPTVSPGKICCRPADPTHSSCEAS